MEDLGIETKEASVREVAKLFPLPEVIASISIIKSDYLSHQQVRTFETSVFPLIKSDFSRFISNLRGNQIQ